MVNNKVFNNDISSSLKLILKIISFDNDNFKIEAFLVNEGLKKEIFLSSAANSYSIYMEDNKKLPIKFFDVRSIENIYPIDNNYNQDYILQQILPGEETLIGEGFINRSKENSNEDIFYFQFGPFYANLLPGIYYFKIKYFIKQINYEEKNEKNNLDIQEIEERETKRIILESNILKIELASKSSK